MSHHHCHRGVSCHVLQDIGVRTTKGIAITKASTRPSFHQELIELDCTACHDDHQGTYLDQFSRKPFTHALLRASVRDRCEACHVAPTNTLHRQFTGNCSQCHSSKSWKYATFDHDKLFVLDKDHNTAPRRAQHVTSTKTSAITPAMVVMNTKLIRCGRST